MKHKKWILAAVIIFGSVISVYFYWRYTTIYPSTSDAYIHGSTVTIAPQINGSVSVLPVKDHQHDRKTDWVEGSAPLHVSVVFR